MRPSLPCPPPVARPPTPVCETTPAVVATAGHDPLRDEGRAYADRLDDRGTAVAHHYPSLAPGFCSLTDDVPAADEAFDEIAASVRDLLGSA